MKTINGMSLRHLCNLELKDENGEDVEIAAWPSFDYASAKVTNTFNLLRNGFEHLIDGYHCNQVASNVYEIEMSTGDRLLVVPTFKD